MSTPGRKYDIFVQHRDVDGNHNQDFQAITAARPWSTKSFEELRLHAYQKHPVPRSQWAASPNTRTVFHSRTSSLKNVSRQLPGSPSPIQTKRPFRELSTETLRFDVGKDSPQTFTVHANLAMDASEFVRIALSPGWKEAKTRTIPLPEDDPDAFKIYLNYLYTHSIFPAGDKTLTSSDYGLLVHSYVIGQKLLDPVFQDMIIDILIAILCTTRTFNIELTSVVYDQTPESSNLRKLWCDIYAYCGDPSWLESESLTAEVNAEFLAGLAKLQLSFWQGQRPHVVPFLADRCRYHGHGTGACSRNLH